MILRIPDYYEEFACIADKCELSCCVDWEIDLEEESYEYYRSIEGPFGDRLRAHMVEDEEGGHRFELKECGRCPFLNDRNFCDIYIELGEEALSEVCTQFPRFGLEFGDVLQKVLSISCEEVGRILFSRKEPVTFLEREMMTYQSLEEEESPILAFENVLITYLEQVQKETIALLQDRSLTLAARLRIFLKLMEKRQEEVNGFVETKAPESVCFVPAELAAYMEEVNPSGGGDRFEDFDQRFMILEELETIGNTWDEMRKTIREGYTADNYKEILASYRADDSCQEYIYEQLAVYFFFRYFMRAVYDYDIVSTAKQVVAFLLMLRSIDAFFWNKDGQNLSMKRRIDIAKVFSREVEHSEENFVNVREAFMFDDVYRLERLAEQI